MILMTFDNPLLVVLTGPTASGKTRTGIHLASHFHSEILSADSRQFFHEMKIGTAFPVPHELACVKHHFIGHLSIHDSYNISRFETDAIQLLERLFQHRRVVFLVGGSGLYINAVCHGIDFLPDPNPVMRIELKLRLEQHGIATLQEELQKTDPEYAAMVDMANPARLIRALEICHTTGVPYSSLRLNNPKERPFRILKIGITHPREVLNERINNRVDQMIDAGLVEEARQLYPYRHLNALNTVGYKELFDHFDGAYPLAMAIEKIKTHSRRYAKRQMTWFTKDAEMVWFLPSETERMISLIEKSMC